MSKLPLTLKSTAAVSKVDATDWTREVWRAAYGMARRVIRERRNHGIGAAWTYYLLHARKRFCTPAAWRLAQLAGKVVFERRTPGHAASGQISDLRRQGLVNAAGMPTRCISVERMAGWRLAWAADPLLSVNSNRSLRVYQAQRRRQVAAVMAADRLALDGRDRIALTVTGVLVLRAAEAAGATA